MLTHHSAMPPLADVYIDCWVNGERRQHAKLDEMIVDIPEIISVLSTGMTLLPGDIIATGTPDGVGMVFRPGRYLKPDDEVKIEISGIGTLINTVAPL